MTSSSSYQHLPSEPPSYDFSDNVEAPGQYHHYQNDPFYIRAHRYTKYKILTPLQRQVLDPLAEIYCDLEKLAELYMAKLGNPLIIKRFLYVAFISLIMTLIVKTGLVTSDSVSGGAGTGGMVTAFSDLPQLKEFINNEEVMSDLKSIEENLEYFSSVNHEAGTIGDLSLAKYVHGYFKQLDSLQKVQLMEVKTLLDYPETVTLAYEDTVLDLSNQFNPLSKSSELIEAGVLYLNYGTLKDYQDVQSSGMYYEDKIVIVKLGQIPVFQKLQTAQSHKVKAVLFINEYEDHPDSFTPVSAAMSNYYPGDPLTPGYSSMLSETRVELDQSQLSQIPSISLSRTQVFPILNRLKSEGFTFPDGISSGDGVFQIKLTNKLQYKKDHSAWNVLAKIEGREQSDEALVIGAKRDSLSATPGTTSANSGTVVLMKIADLLHKLSVKYKWKPLRSIYFISFDATEYNFAGATELVEGKVGETQKETIAYIDVSDGVLPNSEEIFVKSTGLLDTEINKLSEEHPFKWTNFQEYSNVIPFMQYGVPIVQMGYHNGDITTQYPWGTNEDTFQTFKDLSSTDTQQELFTKFLKLSQMVAKLAISISDEPLIPFDMGEYVSKLDHHYRNLQSYQESKTNDKLNYNPILTPLLRLSKLSKDYQTWKDAWAELLRQDSGTEPSLVAVHRWGWNARLNILEKLFIDATGISQERRTFKNVVYGPQFHKPETGETEIDWFTWPSIRDCIDKGGDIQAEIERVGTIIDHGIDYFLQR
ncbi:hypothetical protein WICPIJ_003821 [Wickerhamomyces pijperi]|uniref:FXNA-related family protease 1 n=1 Tax=Wickerhamomyces pijperi TaxID=599730 RepID=A0A9P8Q8Z0_WICPI|nr:hypothetical protein WICPIJ_003821 [Wickerhamomyces pijperi]